MQKAIAIASLIAVSIGAGILLERMILSPDRHFGTEIAYIPVPADPSGPRPPSLPPLLTNAAAIDDALGKLPTIGGPQDRRLVDDFLRRVPAPFLPLAAARAVEPGLRLQPYVIMQICFAWSKADPEAAAKFVLAQEADEYQDRALRRIVEDWANRDVARLAEWAENQNNTQVYRAALPIVIRSLKQSEPGRAATMIGKVPGQAERQLLVQDVYPRWIEADPAAASRKLFTAFLPNMPGVNYLRAALAGWFQLDPAAAFQGIRSAPDTPARRAAVIEAATIMGGTDPTNVLDLIRTLPLEDNNRSLAVGALARAIALGNPSRAIPWARNLRTSRDRDAAMQSVLLALRETDPETLREFVESAPHDPASQTFAGGVASEMAAHSPTDALAWAKQLPPGITRSNALGAIFQSWSAANPAQASAAAATLEGAERNRTLQRIFQSWASSDPFAAANQLLSLNALDLDPFLYTVTAKALVDKSSAQAQEWVLKLPPGIARTNAIVVVLDSLAVHRPANAAEFVQRLPGTEAAILIDRLFSHWFRFDAAAVASWTERIQDPVLRAHAYRRMVLLAAKNDVASVPFYIDKLPPDTPNAQTRHEVALLWGKVEPQPAAEWASRQGTNLIATNTALMVASDWSWRSPEHAAKFVLTLPETLARTHWFREFAGRWSRSDPQATADWILTQAPERDRSTLLKLVIEHWLSRDRQTALQWLREQSNVSNRDLAAEAMVNALAARDPRQAAHIAQTIAESKTRWSSMEYVARSWLREDQPAARRWLTTNSLPRPRKDYLLDEFR